MKLLFVGPHPPPHGGVSVHLANARRICQRAGIQCGVLNVEPRASSDASYIKISNAFDFGRELLRHAWTGWTLHVHTNGHNPKSWWIALASGLAARNGVGGILTLHSGMLPDYLNGNSSRRTLARLACDQYEQVVCVNTKIASSIASLGVPPSRIAVMPAFLPPALSETPLPDDLFDWCAAHDPIISTAVFFRPEYGVEVLITAIAKIKQQFPSCGCLVMGSGPDRLAAEMLIERLNLGGTFRLQGDVDHDLCIKAIARSNVFVRPTFHDGDSISVREALALGIPVVASAVGARPEGVRLFPAGDSEALSEQIVAVLKGEAKGGVAEEENDPARRLFEILDRVSHCPI